MTLYEYSPGAHIFHGLYGSIYKFEVWGAQGGNGARSSSTFLGGKGGYSTLTIIMKRSVTFYIHVGTQGQSGYWNQKNAGGTNGSPHGNGGTSHGYSGFGEGDKSGGGGASTDIRIGINETGYRVVVGGGGGGAGGATDNGGNGGSGGGINGGNGLTTSSNLGLGAIRENGGLPSENNQLSYETSITINTTGGQDASFGGNGADSVYSGGGGGGYAGGGSGSSTYSGGGGSGYSGLNQASSYIGILSGSNIMESGIRSGDGLARITLLFLGSKPKFFKYFYLPGILFSNPILILHNFLYY
jgi:hypothetical protein